MAAIPNLELVISLCCYTYETKDLHMLKKLSLATVMALTLAGCNGNNQSGSNADQTQPTQGANTSSVAPAATDQIQSNDVTTNAPATTTAPTPADQTAAPSVTSPSTTDQAPATTDSSMATNNPSAPSAADNDSTAASSVATPSNNSTT